MNRKNLNAQTDYHETFRRLYYHFYSNSDSSRAERIVSDISKLLLCKLASDRNGSQELLVNYVSGEGTAADTLTNILSNNFPMLHIENEGFSLSDKYLRIGLEVILNLDLLNAPAHIIGDAFQALIGPSIRGDKGQFFTPRNLVRCMVEVLAPRPDENVMDPACGTGGFLDFTYLYWMSVYPQTEITGQLVGVEKDIDLAFLASALLEISTKGSAAILNTNSFEMFINSDEERVTPESVDVVMTNPPFGARIGITDTNILKSFRFGHSWTYDLENTAWIPLENVAQSQDPQTLFLELCIEVLRPVGRLGIVLPEGMFGNKTLGYVWDHVRNEGRILGMIDCPRTTFQPSTDTKTNILFFQKFKAGEKKKTHYKSMVAVAQECGHDRRGRTINASGEPFPDDFYKIGKSYHNKTIEAGIWSSCELGRDYLVPRYYHNPVELVELSRMGELISFGDLLKQRSIDIRKGHEVGADAYGTGHVPFVRTSDVNNFEISVDPTRAISEDIYNTFSKKQHLALGDILMVVDGRYRIGKTVIINAFNCKCVVQSHFRIITLLESAPFEPYELLYLLNLPLVQKQIRNLVFIQSTLATLGKRIEEIRIPLVENTEGWTSRIDDFKQTLEVRANLLPRIKNFEFEIEL